MRETRSQKRRRLARQYVEARLNLAEDRAEIYRSMQLELDWAPSRSTFYAWAQQWDQARARDESGPWSLATDSTGRPDVVLRVLAALLAVSHGQRDEISADDARWLVRLASAVPTEWPDEKWRVKTASGDWQDVIEHGAIRLYNWAVRYADAEARGDTNALALYDDIIASEYWSEDWHRDAWPPEPNKERNA
jgi:hypothetical protein